MGSRWRTRTITSSTGRDRPRGVVYKSPARWRVFSSLTTPGCHRPTSRVAWASAPPPSKVLSFAGELAHESQTGIDAALAGRAGARADLLGRRHRAIGLAPHRLARRAARPDAAAPRAVRRQRLELLVGGKIRQLPVPSAGDGQHAGARVRPVHQYAHHPPPRPPGPPRLLQRSADPALHQVP